MNKLRHFLFLLQHYKLYIKLAWKWPHEPRKSERNIQVNKVKKLDQPQPTAKSLSVQKHIYMYMCVCVCVHFIAIILKRQMKHQLDATLCRFYFCRVTLHVSGVSTHHQEYLKLVQRPLLHVLSLSSLLLIRAFRP